MKQLSTTTLSCLTDFDTGDRLYFDPLTKEDVASIIETEKPYGVVVQFGDKQQLLTKYQSKWVPIYLVLANRIDAKDRN